MRRGFHQNAIYQAGGACLVWHRSTLSGLDVRRHRCCTLADGRQATHRQPDHVIIIVAIGLLNTAMSITTEIKSVGEGLAIGAFILLGIALLIALGFEFVNGFHDTPMLSPLSSTRIACHRW